MFDTKSDSGFLFIQVLGIGLISGLIFLVFTVLQPFLTSIAWALILSCITWPIYASLRKKLKGRPLLSSLIMIVGLCIALVLPILWLVIVVQDDVSKLYLAIPNYINNGLLLPNFIRKIPGIGIYLQNWLDNHVGDMDSVRKQTELWMSQSAQYLLKILGGVGNNISKLGLTLITLFFLYSEGEKWLNQLVRMLEKIIGLRAVFYLKRTNEIMCAVIYSMVFTGISQGLMGAIGYWLMHAPAPILFGVLTAFASILPLFGTFLVWGLLSIWLLINGQQMQALGLLIWGVALINPIDNIVRPLVMSQAGQVHFLITLFGALGGLAAFGMVGLFIGPVVLALSTTLCHEWIFQNNK